MQHLPAIAYNKAIDILKKKGVNKSYTPNYIDGLSPSTYAWQHDSDAKVKGITGDATVIMSFKDYAE